MQLNRRGITLVELLIALVLLGIISAAIYRVLVNNQRIYQSQTQRIDLQQNIRAAVSILPAEFRELDATDNDIQSMSATAITVRATRWLGFICFPPVLGGILSNRTMIIRRQPFFGSRGINTATDQMFVFYDGNVNTRNDDGWALAQPTVTGPGVCPDVPPTPGQTITMNLNLGGMLNAAGGITAGSPVRGFEIVTYQLYQQPGDTSWYVGFRPAGGSMQPIIGPVLPGGLTLSYFDATGVVTNNPTQVARIDITLRGRTAQPVRQTSGSSLLAASVDSVTTSVALRNNRRFGLAPTF